MSEHVEDEVVAPRSSGRAGGRRVVQETVDGETGAAHQTGDDDDDVVHEGGSQRRFGAASEEILAKMESDAKARRAAERAAIVDEDGEEADPDDVGLVEGVQVAKPASAAAAPAAASPAAAAPPADEWKTKYDAVERANRKLVADLEAARAAPRETPLSERHTQLADAEETYVNEGASAAFRKFLGVVLGAAPDSKEVEAELALAYMDLTASDLGVPLTDAQQAKRDAARARLALARDKKERKSAAETPKPVPEQTGADIEKMSSFIGNRLTTKNAEGKSLGDDFPLLTRFSQTLDGMSPDKLIAFVIDRDFRTGVIDVASYGNRDDDLIRDVAKKIEEHYDNLASEFGKAKPPKTDTTQSKPAVAPTSEEQRQSHGARITNANAGAAPATPPTKKTTEKKKLPLKGSARREALFNKHNIPD